MVLALRLRAGSVNLNKGPPPVGVLGVLCRERDREDEALVVVRIR